MTYANCSEETRFLHSTLIFWEKQSATLREEHSCSSCGGVLTHREMMFRIRGVEGEWNLRLPICRFCESMEIRRVS
jgi:hypothetical protein